MKLGEAKRKLAQIERRLLEYPSILSRGPLEGVVPALNDCNQLLREKQILEKAIAETEAITELEGNPLEMVRSAYMALQRKIEYVNVLISRDDLSDNLKDSLFEQLAVLKDSRDSLEKGIEICLWETEVLE